MATASQSVPVPAPAAAARTHSRARLATVAVIAVLLAVVAYYFIGVDEGMTSVFGNTMAVHEWVHDARHLLGFPCH